MAVMYGRSPLAKLFTIGSLAENILTSVLYSFSVFSSDVLGNIYEIFLSEKLVIKNGINASYFILRLLVFY